MKFTLLISLNALLLFSCANPLGKGTWNPLPLKCMQKPQENKKDTIK